LTSATFSAVAVSVAWRKDRPAVRVEARHEPDDVGLPRGQAKHARTTPPIASGGRGRWT